MNHSRRDIVQRLSRAVVSFASLGAITSSGILIAGHAREISIPADEQVSRWVFTTRAFALPLLYATTTIALAGGCAYYGMQRHSYKEPR